MKTPVSLFRLRRERNGAPCFRTILPGRSDKFRGEQVTRKPVREVLARGHIRQIGPDLGEKECRQVFTHGLLLDLSITVAVRKEEKCDLLHF